MLTALRSWSARCSDTLADLESQISAIKAAAASRAAENAAWEQTQARMVDEQRRSDNALGGGAAGGGVHGPRQSRLVDAAVARLRGGGNGNGGQRSGKRGSGSLEAGQDSDEAMDLDEEEPDDGGEGGGSSVGKKLRARRKL